MLNLFSVGDVYTAVRVTEHRIGKTYRPYILYTRARVSALLIERDHIFYVVGRNRQVLELICMPHRWRSGAMGCGVWTVRACGARERAESSGAERGEGSSERQHRRWDCGNCIGGEEVAATFGDTEDLSPRALCLCRYAPPATYSHALPAFYLSVKKNV